MANWNFDATQYKEQDFQIIPAGDHRVRIEDVIEKKFNSGNEGYEITLSVNGYNSKLWFSAGEEFYYIAWRGENITPEIKEIVKSASKSDFNHTEFYRILNEEYQNYKIVNATESQGSDYPASDSGSHTFFTVGTNGAGFGIIT